MMDAAEDYVAGCEDLEMPPRSEVRANTGPSESEARPSLIDEIRALASSMADSVGCTVADVLRRTKSRSWILGRIKRLCVGRTDEEIRDAIVQLAQQNRPVARDDMLERLSDPEQQAPQRILRGLEPASSELWQARVEQLAECLTEPMDVLGVFARASTELGWGRNLTIQTLSAAEDAGALEWTDGTWKQTENYMATTAAKQKTTTKPVQRHLHVQLSPKELEAQQARLGEINAERKALEEELAKTTRELRARLRQTQEDRERVIEAMTTGRALRIVQCEERWDYSLRQVSIIRKDTGQLVGIPREMTPAELQGELQFEATKSKPSGGTARVQSAV